MCAWALDREGHRLVGTAGVSQPLTNLEFQLLSLLESRPGGAVPIDELGDSLWGMGQWSRYMLYNAVKRARRRLDACAPGAGQSIVSVARTGYRLDHEASATEQPTFATPVGRSLRPGRRGLWLFAGAGITGLLASVMFALSARPEDSLPPSNTTVATPPEVALDAIKGRAVDVEGRPLAGVNVVACNARTLDICPRSTTGTDGTFEIALDQGIWQVSLRRDGQALATFDLATGVFHDVVIGDGPSAPGRLATATPAGTARLSGRLIDAVAGVQVTACNAETPNPCPFGYLGPGGEFELLVREGRYVLSFSLPGQGTPALSVAMNTGETREFNLPR